jgi:hypothetical protein
MEGLESKLQQIMGNPDLMQQIMSMAQGFQSPPPEEPPQPVNSPLPDIDMATVSRLAGLASQSSIDPNQQRLLSALIPYLSQQRISRLEKAMRASKMASLASTFLTQSYPGR